MVHLSADCATLKALAETLELACPICHLPDFSQDAVLYSCCLTLAHGSCTDTNQQHSQECPKCTTCYELVSRPYSIWTKLLHKALQPRTHTPCNRRQRIEQLLTGLISRLWQDQYEFALTGLDQYLEQHYDPQIVYPCAYFPLAKVPAVTGLSPEVNYNALTVDQLNPLELAYVPNDETAYNQRPVILVIFSEQARLRRQRLFRLVSRLEARYLTPMYVAPASRPETLYLCVPGLGRNYVILCFQTNSLRKVIETLKVPVYWQDQWFTNMAIAVDWLSGGDRSNDSLVLEYDTSIYLPYALAQIPTEYRLASQYLADHYPDWQFIMEVCQSPASVRGVRTKLVCNDLLTQPHPLISYQLVPVADESANRLYLTNGQARYFYLDQITGQGLESFIQRTLAPPAN